jgi:iron complex outermembrane receptor protein
VTDAFKVRAGVRQDWWDTTLTPRISVPGRFGTDAKPLLAGVGDSRNDAPVSWNIGALYKALPWMSPYVGVSSSHLTNFNSENTQNGVGEPESALQYEAGIKFAWLDDRVLLNTAAFDVRRNHVATATTLDGVETVVFDSHLLANLWTTYRFRIGSLSGFRVGAGVNYQDKSYSDITNASSIPSFAVVNMLVGYDASTWGLDVNVHNVTDRRYFTAANGAGAYVGEPRSAFVTLRANL